MSGVEDPAGILPSTSKEIPTCKPAHGVAELLCEILLNCKKRIMNGCASRSSVPEFSHCLDLGSFIECRLLPVYS